MVEAADELAVASISWYELAWLAHHERIVASIPLRSWLGQLSDQVRTLRATVAIAATAATLPDSFPRDPVDRIVYATAVEHGLPLMTKDEQMRGHGRARRVAIW
jgi:PIN domain nuclease of toxin-antitoxin system